jgi:hypothetical protein
MRRVVISSAGDQVRQLLLDVNHLQSKEMAIEIETKSLLSHLRCSVSGARHIHANPVPQRISAFTFASGSGIRSNPNPFYPSLWTIEYHDHRAEASTNAYFDDVECLMLG